MKLRKILATKQRRKGGEKYLPFKNINAVGEKGHDKAFPPATKNLLEGVGWNWRVDGGVQEGELCVSREKGEGQGRHVNPIKKIRV